MDSLTLMDLMLIGQAISQVEQTQKVLFEIYHDIISFILK